MVVTRPQPPHNSPRESSSSEVIAQDRRILSALIEASPLGIYSIDLNAIVTSWNPSCERIFGWKAEEVIGKPLPIIPSRWKDQFEDLFALLQSGQRFTDLELQRIRKDGTEITISLSTAPIHDAEGKTAGVLGITSDISARKRTEEAIRESEKRYRSLFQDSRAVMLLVNPTEGIIVDANRAAHQYYGYSPDRFHGMPISRITPDRLEARHEQNQIHQDSQEHFFTRHQLADGSVRDVEVHSTPIDMVGQHLLCAIVHDVTDKVQLEAHLRQSQKREAVATLAGGIAHDFNNILSAMLGFVDLIRMETPSDSTIRPYVEEIRIAAKRAKDLIGQIFCITRETEEAYHPIQIQTIIKEALKLLRGALPSTIEIFQDISPTCGPILGDPVQVHQVLMNLCTNAYQAMPTGGVLEVSLQEKEIPAPAQRAFTGLASDRFACLTVRDSGQGMDELTKSRIFDPYFTTKEPKEGTGLGLAIVQGIVTHHGGCILVDSAPLQGATFRVFFPLCSSPEVTQDNPVHPDLAQGHNEHILFVDDETPIVKMRSILLEKMGYRVTGCKSGQEALSYFFAKPWDFDIVITDLTMPRMTGIALGRRIQAIRPGLPVILCTGQFTTSGGGEETKAAGIRRILQKPVDDGVLAQTIHEILQETSASRHPRPPMG